MTRLAAVTTSALTLVLTVGLLEARAQGGAGTTIPMSAVPVSVDGLKAGTHVELNVETIGGSTSSGTAGGSGLLDFLSDVGIPGKPHVRLYVYMGQCVDGSVRIAIVESGADPKTIPPECNPRIVGFFWLDRAKHVSIHVGARTVTVQNDGMGTGMKTGIGAAGGLGALLAALAGRGGADGGPGATVQPNPAVTVTPPTPTTTIPPVIPPSTPGLSTAGGNFDLMWTVTADLNFSRTFVNFETVRMVTISIVGANIALSAPPPWVMVSGPIDLTSGRFTANGSGFVAGRNNVPSFVEGTLTFTDVGFAVPLAVQATTTFNVVVGGGGSLPGSADDGKVRYSVTGRRP